MRLAALFLLLTAPLSSCGASASAERGIKPGDTQVVAQWSLSAKHASGRGSAGFVASMSAVNGCLHGEGVIEKGSDGLYFVDGNDIGGGVCNIYLYTDRIDATVSRLVTLARAGRIPSDLRVGVAIYKDNNRSDWTYRAAYPATLSKFELSGG